MVLMLDQLLVVVLAQFHTELGCLEESDECHKYFANHPLAWWLMEEQSLHICCQPLNDECEQLNVRKDSGRRESINLGC